MIDLIWLSEAQMRRIEPHFSMSHGVPRVDGRRVVSGIILVIRNGLRWRDAPKDCGPHKTIYNRFTHFAMGLAKVLGFDLCPHLAGFSGRKLHLPRGVSVPARLEPIVERVPLGRTARAGWDGVQHIAASLQSGYGSAATIIERHSSAARGNPVYECGTLIGKVTRSVFMLDHLVNPEFRREIHRLLAQGEPLHALQRALLAGRIEAKHGRTEEDANAISGALTLLTYVVLAWNTATMQSKIDANLDQYPAGHLAHIAHIAPVAHRHINMKGVMRFTIEPHNQLVRNGTGKAQQTARPANPTT